MYTQNTQHGAKEKKRAAPLHTVLKNAVFVVVGGDGAGTYLRYILPAHPDHNCEKDALVRRQKGPEGSYPGLSGRWGDQIDWTQTLLAI